MKSNILAAPMLGTLLVLVACGEPPSGDILRARIADRMASNQVCNRASVEYFPNGARISLPDSALFIIGRAELNPCGQYEVASIIETMLNTGNMQITIEPTGDIEAPYYGLARQRAEILKELFSNVAFVPFHPPVLVQVKSTGSGVWGIVLTAANSSQIDARSDGNAPSVRHDDLTNLEAVVRHGQCLQHAAATASTAIAAAMTTAFIWRLPRAIMPPAPAGMLRQGASNDNAG
jgi:hypothetical protein